MLNEYNYEPFGAATETGSDGNPFQYTGRENDGTGLYYYRARYYHPGLARFISEDPIGFDSGDVNLYSYVANNPITWLDPKGEAKRRPWPKICVTLRNLVKVSCYAPTRCNEGDSCAVLLAKISIKTVCLIAQEEFTRVCYADNPSHLERIAEMKRGIKRCQEILDAECNICKP